MTNGVLSSTVAANYSANMMKNVEQKSTTTKEVVTQERSSSKVEQIKKQIQEGTYQVDIEATAKKMAQELLL